MFPFEGSSWTTAKDTNVQRQDSSATNMHVDIPAIKSFKRAGIGTLTFGGATTLDNDNNNETAEKKRGCALHR